MHPLLVQRQLMEQQLAKLAESNERRLKRLFRVGWKGLRSKKLSLVGAWNNKRHSIESVQMRAILDLPRHDQS